MKPEKDAAAGLTEYSPALAPLTARPWRDLLVGVLALQGDFSSHCGKLRSLGTGVREVRTVEDLSGCDALVIPGGESTTLTRLLMEPGTGPGTGKEWVPGPLWHALKEYALGRPVMGTCAGLILLARPCGDSRVVSLDLLDVEVERNAWGRQTESFAEELEVSPAWVEGRADHGARTGLQGIFIRAPRVRGIGPGVEVLAWSRHSGLPEPVLVRQGHMLGMGFHPELDPGDARIHEYFLSLV